MLSITRSKKSSKLSSLNPFIDEVGLMCVDGRLQHADYLPYDSRCPIILPSNAWVTTLLVKHEHEKGHHVAGVSHTFEKGHHVAGVSHTFAEISMWF